jgi:hypothetical protein
LTTLHESKYFTWQGNRDKINGPIEKFYDYLDHCYEALQYYFQVTPKTPIVVTINDSSGCEGGISGSTWPGNLAYCAGNWDLNHWCYGLLAQELVNLFTGDVSPGWPATWHPTQSRKVKMDGEVKWWADGHSPFPIMISVELMKLQGLTLQAQQHDDQFSSDAWFNDFKRIHATKGWAIWRRLFDHLRQNKVDLSKMDEESKTSFLMSLIMWFRG